MNQDSELNFFKHSHHYYRFIFLKKIDELGHLNLPIHSNDTEFLRAVSKIHIQNLISDGLLKKNTGDDNSAFLELTIPGQRQLRKHFIDYQLDLLKLEKQLGDFYSDKITKLKQENVRKIALYGASDTAQSFLKYLQNQGFETVCFIDDDPQKQGNSFLNLPVISPQSIDEFRIDAVVISTVEFQDKIAHKMKSSFGSKYKILALFD